MIPPKAAGLRLKVFWCIMFDNNDDYNILVLWFNNASRGRKKKLFVRFSQPSSSRRPSTSHRPAVCRSIFIYYTILYYINIIIITIVCSLTISYDQFYMKKKKITYRLLGGEQKTNLMCNANAIRTQYDILYKNRETC